ncbi:MAG: CBS domain-containing protein [Candidatus Pacearchaeota archaeon]
MLIRDVMKQPYVIEKDLSLREAAKIMSSKDIGCLLFVSDRTIKGILTERDLMKNFDKNSKVSNVMSTKIISIGPDETLDKALELMRNKKIKRLPVIENGKLVGIITLTDLAQHFEDVEEDFFFE